MGRAFKSPLIYWHLLSLDAPTVATLWTWFIAKADHVALSASSLAAMATAVWMLYAGDRLLDVRGSDPGEFEERHHFHLRNRRRFLAGIAAASMMLALLLPAIPAEALRLYLVLGGLVAGYFVVIHATEGAHRLPKEVAVGVCFAAAVFIPTVARAPRLRPALLAPAMLLAALCSLNCLFIYAWEHPERRLREPHPLTAAGLRHVQAIAAGVATISTMMTIFNRNTPWQLHAAVAVAAVSLLFLHRGSRGQETVTMRAAADFVLLAPLLLVEFL